MKLRQFCSNILNNWMVKTVCQWQVYHHFAFYHISWLDFCLSVGQVRCIGHLPPNRWLHHYLLLPCERPVNSNRWGYQARNSTSLDHIWPVQKTRIQSMDCNHENWQLEKRSLHLPCIHEAIQVQAFHWAGNSSQTGQAAAGSQTDSNWSKTQQRKTKESHKSFTCRLIIFWYYFT